MSSAEVASGCDVPLRGDTLPAMPRGGQTSEPRRLPIWEDNGRSSRTDATTSLDPRTMADLRAASDTPFSLLFRCRGALLRPSAPGRRRVACTPLKWACGRVCNRGLRVRHWHSATVRDSQACICKIVSMTTTAAVAGWPLQALRPDTSLRNTASSSKENSIFCLWVRMLQSFCNHLISILS